MSIGLLVMGLVLFILLVIVHEAGHFILARRNGVEVKEFGLFFPPRVWSRRTKAGWILSLNLLPLGGFVRLKGEHDSSRGPHTYGSARTLIQVKILLAGIGMNLLAAFLILTVVAWLGMPQVVPNQFTITSDSHVFKNEVLVSSVLPGSPAAGIHLQADDRLLAIGPAAGRLIPISSAQNLPQLTKKLAGEKVTLEYARSGQTKTVQVQLLSQNVVSASQKTANPKGYLGVTFTSYSMTRATWSAPIDALGLMGQFTLLTFKGIGSALGGLGSLIAGAVTSNPVAQSVGQARATAQVAGPVGVFEILKAGTGLGYQFVLFFIGYLSLVLAIMNLLPIPILDGGKLYTTLIARAFNKTMSERFETLVYGASFLLLLALMILITINDVHRFG